MKNLLIGVAALALISAASQASARSRTFNNEADLTAAVMPSFVNIYNRAVKPTQQSEAKDSPLAAATTIEDDVGSGVIVDSSGLIATNRHVIEGAYALFVTTSDGKRYPAKLVGKALTYDLALIKIETGKPLKAAVLGDSTKLRLGQRVVAIGNPLGFANSVSSGVISAFHRNIGLSAFDDLIQTDATINRGNSGGPLFNMKGEVIGINEAIYTQNKGGSIGIGFSIPVDDLRYLLASIKTHGKPYLGWIGVVGQTVHAGMAKSLNIPNKQQNSLEDFGVILSEVRSGSPAEKSGLKVGDIIVAIGGQPITNIVQLHRVVAESIDKTPNFDVIRNGSDMKIPVKIDNWPEDLWSSKLAPAPKVETAADFGVVLKNQPDGKGALISNVAERSIAWSAGARPGDVILKIKDIDVTSVDQLNEQAKKLQSEGKSTLPMLLSGPNGTRWIGVSMFD